MTNDEISYLVFGPLLVAGGLYLAFHVSEGARDLERYYRSGADSYSGKGLWGKPVFLPGRKTTLVAAGAIALSLIVFGATAIVLAFV